MMQVSRPLTMKKEGIQTRKRKPKVASSSNSSGGSSSSSNVHQSGDKSSSKSQWFFFMGFFFPHPIPSIALINDSREREREREREKFVASGRNSETRTNIEYQSGGKSGNNNNQRKKTKKKKPDWGHKAEQGSNSISAGRQNSKPVRAHLHIRRHVV